MKTIKYMVLFIFFSLAVNTIAQENKITVRVDGLSCPFCSYTLEKKFIDISSVEKFNIDYKKGTMTLNLKKDKKITDSFITKKIEEAGFTVNKIIRDKKTESNKEEEQIK